MAVDEVATTEQVFCEPPSEDEAEPQKTACNLVHPAGFGVVDTGCGRGVIGEDTSEA